MPGFEADPSTNVWPNEAEEMAFYGFDPANSDDLRLWANIEPVDGDIVPDYRDDRFEYGPDDSRSEAT